MNSVEGLEGQAAVGAGGGATNAEVTLPVTDTSTLFAKVPFNGLLGLRREFCEAGQARMVLETRDQLTNNSISNS